MAENPAIPANLDLLKKEIDIVHEGIVRYGDVQFKIKGWAITIFSAFVIFALEYKQPVMLLACGVTVALFWILDAFYKSLQSVYLKRAKDIEDMVKSPERMGALGSREEPVFDLESKFAEWERCSLWKNFREYGGLPQLKPLYLVMLAALVFLYALDWTQFSPWLLASER